MARCAMHGNDRIALSSMPIAAWAPPRGWRQAKRQGVLSVDIPREDPRRGGVRGAERLAAPQRVSRGVGYFGIIVGESGPAKSPGARRVATHLR